MDTGYYCSGADTMFDLWHYSDEERQGRRRQKRAQSGASQSKSEERSIIMGAIIALIIVLLFGVGLLSYFHFTDKKDIGIKSV